MTDVPEIPSPTFDPLPPMPGPELPEPDPFQPEPDPYAPEPDPFQPEPDPYVYSAGASSNASARA